jgi:hypothetical protein
MWVSLENQAFNLGQITSAEWDEADRWIDLRFTDGHATTIHGGDALTLIDAVLNVSRLHDQNVTQTLRAYSQITQSEGMN